MNCEYCEQQHDGKYGSGRFCSIKCRQSFLSKKANTPELNEKRRKKLTKKLIEVKSSCECCKKEFLFQQKEDSSCIKRFCSKFCAKSFSTKSKRKEINEKIKKSLAEKSLWRNRLRLIFEEKFCEFCKTSFSTKNKRKKFCSLSCGAKFHNQNPAYIEKLRLARLKEIEKGNVGYGIKTEYDGIRCDSALEYAFLKWYKTTHPEAKIERFKGYLEGEGIKYQPDFIIDDKIIVEVKYTTPYIGEKLSEKWKTYVSSQETKKKLLLEKEYLWITEKDIGGKFYRQCLKEIKDQKLLQN